MEVSILLADDSVISDLNKRYLNRKSTTDVLAFRMGEGAFSHLHPQLLGDVVICTAMAKRRAAQLHTDYESEINLYLVHGILHLLGFQDTTKKGFRLMQKAQKEILEKYA